LGWKWDAWIGVAVRVQCLTVPGTVEKPLHFSTKLLTLPMLYTPTASSVFLEVAYISGVNTLKCVLSDPFTLVASRQAIPLDVLKAVAVACTS
jgi:hypothetical protein